MKKTLTMVLALVLVAAISVGATLAYLTSSDTVTNTFTVGNVAITLDEKDVDNDNNQADNITLPDDTVRDKANSYKLLPGHTYTKDPIVHVSSTSEDCYLFVKVTNQIADIEASNTIENPNIKVASQMAAKGWVAVDNVPGVYVYTQNSAPAVVKGGSNVAVFDNFTVSGTVNNETLATYNGKTIVVNAYAIQADGFTGKTASEIWTAANFN